MGTWQDMTDNVMIHCRDTFTTDLVYKPVVGAQVSIQGIFDEAYTAVIIQDGVPIETRRPKLGIRNKDLILRPAKGDKCIINGSNYRVVEYEPDGEAGTALFLYKE